MKIIRKNKVFFIFLFITFWTALCSSGVNRTIALPMWFNRIGTLLAYSPLLLSMLWKLVCDIRKKRFTGINIVYYIFAAYYAVLTGYRLINGSEFKESIYWTISLFGSVALYLQIYYGDIKITRREYATNFIAIGIYMVLFRLVHSLVGKHILVAAPINPNITTGVVALLVPFLVDILCDPQASKKQMWMSGLTLSACLVVIATAGSRAIFLLTAMVVAALLGCRVWRYKNLRRVAASCLLSVLVVASMMAVNVGNVRYAVYRQINISFLLPNAGMSDPIEPDESDPDKDTQDAAQQQINNSDAMRSDLIQMGLEQIEQNLWFGTGDVEYPYAMAEDYIPNQSSHNFIIETIICYGLIGSILLIVLLVLLVLTTHIAKKPWSADWRIRISLMLTALFFFGLGMVEPTVYNKIMCPTFVMLMAGYGLFLLPKEEIPCE